MAKRKRLTPARPGYLDGPATGARAPETKAMPMRPPAPIAQVAGQASAVAALEELSGQMASARAEGRLIEALPLDQIDDAYLVRDRIEQDEDELTALMDSLRARGQQTAVEVIALPDHDGAPRYGLISGWRRLTALKRLYAETSESEFSRIKALIITPETAQAAYVAMVEENEIRVNLSLYERARIARRTVEEGVYPSARVALQGLYGAATRSKRSKIGSFMDVVDAFDGALRFPTAIPERLGLALARAVQQDPGFADRARATLLAHPSENAAAELKALAALVPDRAPSAPREPSDAVAPSPASEQAAPKTPPMRHDIDSGLRLSYDRATGRVEMTGDRIDDAFVAALTDWLRQS